MTSFRRPFEGHFPRGDRVGLSGMAGFVWWNRSAIMKPASGRHIARGDAWRDR